MGLTGLLFLAAYAAGCILALARHPIFGLITYVAAFYLHPPSRWWGQAMPDLRWSLMAAAVTVLGVMMNKRLPARRGLFRKPPVIGLVAFIAWLVLQIPLALDSEYHMILLTLYAKYLLLMVLMYKCIDSVEHLLMFLWAHVLGCLYLGWIVFTTYVGGRFEGFGGPDINEANAGAMQIVTGIFFGSALFLGGSMRDKAILFGGMPFIVNAVIATMSRGAFLAAGVGGLIFNYFTPRKYRKRVRLLSVLALVLFILLTNPLYWARMASLKQAGEEVEGADTGSDRVVLMKAQVQMFASHPLGCGHRCTAVLSPYYLDDEYLTTNAAGVRARASHSTIMTMLVEHGIPGVIFYALLVLWLIVAVWRLARRLRDEDGFLATLVPAIGAATAALTVGDLFVDYLKMEVRFWLITLLLIMLDMTADRVVPARKKGPGHRAPTAPPHEPRAGDQPLEVSSGVAKRSSRRSGVRPGGRPAR